MPRAFHIDYLAENAELIPLLAQWHHAEWPLASAPLVEDRIELIRNRLGRREMPTTLVAVRDANPLGFVSLVSNNMDSHPELFPWLASLYVPPPLRRQGIGTALVKAILEEAQALPVRHLYLFTPSQNAFYERLGWHVIFHENYHGENVTVMEFEFAPALKPTQ